MSVFTLFFVVVFNVGFKSSQDLVLLCNIYTCMDYKLSFELEPEVVFRDED